MAPKGSWYPEFPSLEKRRYTGVFVGCYSGLKQGLNIGLRRGSTEVFVLHAGAKRFVSGSREVRQSCLLILC